MVRNNIGIGAGLAIGVFSAGVADAALIDQVDIAYWVDQGSENEAVLVLDSGDEQVAFGYRWDGESTSWDMLQAIDDAGSLDVSATESDTGVFVSGFTYGEFTLFGDWPSSMLVSWVSDDGENWTAASVGVQLRSLTDGAFDGWSLDFDTSNFIYENPPQTPLVPEPASLAMLGVVGVAVLRRRGR